MNKKQVIKYKSVDGEQENEITVYDDRTTEIYKYNIKNNNKEYINNRIINTISMNLIKDIIENIDFRKSYQFNENKYYYIETYKGNIYFDDILNYDIEDNLLVLKKMLNQVINSSYLY